MTQRMKVRKTEMAAMVRCLKSDLKTETLGLIAKTALECVTSARQNEEYNPSLLWNLLNTYESMGPNQPQVEYWNKGNLEYWRMLR